MSWWIRARALDGSGRPDVCWGRQLDGQKNPATNGRDAVDRAGVLRAGSRQEHEPSVNDILDRAAGQSMVKKQFN